MPRKRDPNKFYFTQETENAIVQYVASTSQRERDELFAKHIYKPFCKIAEVVYNKYKIQYLGDNPQDAMADAVIFMVEKLPMFKQGAGKAFSYFTIVCRNYYIQESNKNYAKQKKVSKFGDLPERYDIPNDDKRVQEMEDNAVLLTKFTNYLEEHIEKIFYKKHEVGFGKLLIQTIRDIDSIDNFNRRDMLNELSDKCKNVSRANITKILNRIEVHYTNFKEDYLTDRETSFYKKKKLNTNQITFIKENYKVNCKQTGMVALAKRFGVEEEDVRKAYYS